MILKNITQSERIQNQKITLYDSRYVNYPEKTNLRK